MGRPLTTAWDDTLRVAMAEPGEWFRIMVPAANHSMCYRLRRMAERLGGKWEFTSRGRRSNPGPGDEVGVYWRYLGSE